METYLVQGGRFAYRLLVWLFCFNQAGGFVERPGGFLGGPTTLDLNELGDLLAGLFAPLAFLWLLIAVMVQAQELSAQRAELRLTRREFVESRKVAQAQANEARKQAEFIGAQTAILKEQWAGEVLQRNGEAIIAELRSLGPWLDVRLGRDWRIERKNTVEGHEVPGRISDPVQQAIRTLAVMRTAASLLGASNSWDDVKLVAVRIERLDELLPRIRPLLRFTAESLGAEHMPTFRELNVVGTHNASEVLTRFAAHKLSKRPPG